MERRMSRILKGYGKEVLLLTPQLVELKRGFAYVQTIPMSKQGAEQLLPTDLGLENQERFLYLGEASLSLKEREGHIILCDGVHYLLHSAQAVWMGKLLSHWRGVMSILEEVRP